MTDKAMANNGKDLLQRMWLTKGSRYNAHRRLQKKHDLSISSIAFLSSYVLIINSLKFAKFLEINQIQSDFITFFSIVVSIFILTLSLLDTSKDYKMRSDKLYMSAVEIDTLYNELEYILSSGASKKEKEKKVHQISVNYSKVLQLYQVNHETQDFDLLISNTMKKSFIRFFKNLLISIKTKVLPYLMYYILIIATPVMAVTMLAVKV